jgi:hypothetical protein
MDWIFEEMGDRLQESRRTIFEALRNDVRRIRGVESMSYEELQAVNMDCDTMNNLALSLDMVKPTIGAGGRRCTDLVHEMYDCAISAIKVIRSKIESIRNLVVLTYDGESMWTTLGYYPSSLTCVIEICHLPAFKMMLHFKEEVMMRKRNLYLSEEEYHKMMNKSVDCTLLKAWKMFCVGTTPLTTKRIAETMRRYYHSDVHAEMISELFNKIISFGQQNEATLDYHCKVTLSRQTYIRQMSKYIDPIERFPLTHEEREERKIQKAFVTAHCGIFCFH